MSEPVIVSPMSVVSSNFDARLRAHVGVGTQYAAGYDLCERYRDDSIVDAVAIDVLLPNVGGHDVCNTAELAHRGGIGIHRARIEIVAAQNRDFERRGGREIDCVGPLARHRVDRHREVSGHVV